MSTQTAPFEATPVHTFALVPARVPLGPPLMTGLFYYATQKNAPIHFPGAPFFLGGILLLVSVILAYYNLKGKKNVPAPATEASVELADAVV